MHWSFRTSCARAALAACIILSAAVQSAICAAPENSTTNEAEAPCCRQRRFEPYCPPAERCSTDAALADDRSPWPAYGDGFGGFGPGPLGGAWLGGYPGWGEASWFGGSYPWGGWCGPGRGYLGGGGWGAFWNPYASFWPYGHGPGYRPGLWYSWPSSFPLHFGYPYLNAGPPTGEDSPAGPELSGPCYW